MIRREKIVIFGAGKIGRSFIGQLFSQAGYEVVFVDIDRKLISEMNLRGKYRIVIREPDGETEQLVDRVRGIALEDTGRVVSELSTAGIVSTSVGSQGLKDLVPVIGKGLVARRERFGEVPLDIILAENMRDADLFLAGELRQHLPADYPLDRLVGLVETSIGKMVPIMKAGDLEEDPLRVFAEAYHTLIVSKNGFKNPVPSIADLAPRENIKAWVDRKIFIHNLGHAASAYLGHVKHPEAIYIYEVLKDPEIEEGTRSAMMQSAEILMKLHPGEFTAEQLSDHIGDLIGRFRNQPLGDTVFRVGSDLFRKLGPADRLVTPIRAAIQMEMPYDRIMKVLLSAMEFRATSEQGRHLPSDELFFREAEKGTAYLLRNVCGLHLPAPDETV